MVLVTVSVSSELKHKMDSFAEINWSEVARQAFSQKIQDMEFLRRYTSKSTLTEKDALRLGRQVSAAVARRHGIKV